MKITIHSIAKTVERINPEFKRRVSNLRKMINYYRRRNIKGEKIPKALEKEYKQITGKTLDLKNVNTYSEKIQWLKIYDASLLKSNLTDKVKAKEWAKNAIGEDYIIKTLGVYEKFEDIDFSQLPTSFVIKTNHASGWNVVVKDKNNFNYKKIKKQFDKWLSIDYAYYSPFEMHYSRIKPCILIEEYVNDANGELNDYKFLCFNGSPLYFWIDFDRNSNHKRNVYDMKWNLQPWNQYTYGNYYGTVNKPENFNKMYELANIMCKGFKHVRVDLYNVDGKIYFGEMTFTNGSGFEGIFPEKYDRKLGEYIDING